MLAPVPLVWVTVVVGRVFDFKSYEPSGFMGVGDAMALEELNSHVKAVGVRPFNMVYSDQLGGDELDANFILIGGPNVNTLANEVMPRPARGLHFGDTASMKSPFRMIGTGTVYAPEVVTLIGDGRARLRSIVKRRETRSFPPSRSPS